MSDRLYTVEQEQIRKALADLDVAFVKPEDTAKEAYPNPNTGQCYTSGGSSTAAYPARPSIAEKLYKRADFHHMAMLEKLYKRADFHRMAMLRLEALARALPQEMAYTAEDALTALLDASSPRA